MSCDMGSFAAPDRIASLVDRQQFRTLLDQQRLGLLGPFLW